MIERESMFSIFVILLGIVMCSVMPDKEKKEEPKRKKKIKHSKKEKLNIPLIEDEIKIEENILVTESHEKINEQEIIKIGNYDIYEKMSVEEAVKKLQKKGELAKEIVSTFPQFPSLENYIIPQKSKKGQSIGEMCCANFLKLLFPQHNFIKIRPDWLKNPKTGKNLELDLFCEELMIAVEYNGEQHYVFPHFYNKTEEEFIKLQDRDKTKEKICMDKNICLIRIPYTVPPEKIPIAIYCYLLDGVPEFENYFKINKT